MTAEVQLVSDLVWDTKIQIKASEKSSQDQSGDDIAEQ